MDEAKWAAQFNEDVDHLLGQGSPRASDDAPEEYQGMLATGDRLSRADYSADSRVGSALRARLVEQSQKENQRAVRRLALPGVARYALVAIFLLACAVGLSRAIETFLPRGGPSGQLPGQATAGPIILPEEYMGAPRPMVLEVDGQSQTAAVGSYCWISAKEGTTFKQACAEVAGQPTPRQPLRIGSPRKAMLRSPFPSTPTNLSLLILAIGADSQPMVQTADTLTWKLGAGQVQTLPLQPEPIFDVILPDGLYAFSLQGTWPDLGTVTYGFLVQVEHAIPTATVRVEPTVEPPTPAPTAAGLATASPAVAEGFYATQQVVQETAIAARATASPFPTGAAARVQPGRPAVALARRGGLSLQVSLPKDEFVAGEGGLAQVTVRNDGSETLMIDGDGRSLAGMTLLDAQGQTPDPWPYSWFWMMSGPPYLVKLEPGQQLDAELQFQIPPASQDAPGEYALWAETRFSRLDPLMPDGPDNVWLRVESGPITLKITPPGPSNRLNVDFSADPTGWHLKVSPAAGGALPAALWGEIGATSNGGTTAGPLHLAPDRSAAAAWGDNMFVGGEQMLAGGWVAAPGYVTQPFSQVVPGRPGDYPLPNLAAYSPPRQSFTSLEAAQTGIAVPIARPAGLPAGAALAGVQATWTGSGYMTIDQRYRLAGGGWLTLSQYVYNPGDDNGGWGQARYDMEAQAVQVNGSEAYASRQKGWVKLDWRAGKMGFELNAPEGALTLAELIQLAASIN